MLKRFPTKISRRKFIADMQARHKFHLLESGLFARVYGNSTEKYVYKIAWDNEENEAYRAFVVAALRRQDNPWFPKIQSAVINRPPVGDGYMVVAMERLLPLALEHPASRYCNVLHEPIDDPKMDHWMNTDYFKDLSGVLRHLFRRFTNDLHEANIMMRPGDQHPVIIDPVQ
jgi:hypothetical protein